MPDWDAFDRRILAELQRDGRIANVALAERVALSETPCLRRLRRLEREGPIQRYAALLDRAALGLKLTVFVEITVAKHNRENAELLHARFASFPEVVACHMVSGEADFLAEVVVPDLESYERFLTERLLTLDAIEGVRSNFSLRTIKLNAPLPLDHFGRDR